MTTQIIHPDLQFLLRMEICGIVLGGPSGVEVALDAVLRQFMIAIFVVTYSERLRVRGGTDLPYSEVIFILMLLQLIFRIISRDIAYQRRKYGDIVHKRATDETDVRRIVHVS